MKRSCDRIGYSTNNGTRNVNKRSNEWDDARRNMNITDNKNYNKMKNVCFSFPFFSRTCRTYEYQMSDH